MSEKFKTVDGYSANLTRDCETALVVLLQAFGSLKDTLRLVGGLVPRYLTPERSPEVPPHAGTTDVDVVLNVSVLAVSDSVSRLPLSVMAPVISSVPPLAVTYEGLNADDSVVSNV